MEFLNRIELRGIVGNASVQNVGDTKVARLSVATDHSYRNRSGEPVIETTWHQVTAWESDKTGDLASIRKGTAVEVKGRLRNVRYTDATGEPRTFTEILAQELKTVSRDGGEE